MYKLNGKEIKYLNRLVLETVKQYIKDNLNITYAELKNVFKDNIQGSYGVLKDEKDLEDLKKYIIDTPKRFFMKEDEVLSLSNGDKIYVCKGWGDDYTDSNGKYKKGNKKAFIELVSKLNYDLELLDINLNTNNLSINDAIKQFIDTLDINESNEPKVGKEFKTRSQGRIYYVYTNHNRNIMTKPLNGTREFSQPIPVFERYLKTGSINQDNDSSYIIPIGNYIKEHYLENIPKELNSIKNIILYGAPGVGKTHNTKKLITLIESNQDEKTIFKEIENNTQNSGVEISLELENRVKFVTFHQSYSYEDFIEGFRPNLHANIELKDGIFKEMVSDAIKDEENNYYLIIDEINRGNISKIFGELITLIEEDKRDIYEVTLPYSKEKFKVPSNLYIIATMNSTDKSIATIDIALRRRFTFLKMKPNEELITFSHAKEVFNKLNTFIEEHLSEDYKLGHSYFMKIQNKEDLEFVKEYKIKPLLEEYFYADEDNYKKVIEILENKIKAENE